MSDTVSGSGNGTDAEANDSSGTGTIAAGLSRRDVGLFLAFALAVYAVYVAIGLAAGLSTNEIAATLQRVTLTAAVFALLVLALNLHWGYTGLFNIGVAGFMAIGAYTMAILTAPTDPVTGVAGLGLPLWVGILAGTVVAGLAGIIIALPALRVRADYFAIITLGFAEIVRLSLNTSALREVEIGDRVYGTGGGRGISHASTDEIVESVMTLPGLESVFDWILSSAEAVDIGASVVERFVLAAVVAACAVIVLLALNRLSASPFGRVLKAIREDEIVARSLGKDTQRAKIKAFAFGCAIMGFAGSFWGSASRVSPDTYLPIITFYVFLALIIGGSGSNFGSLIGAFAFAAFLWEGPRFLRTAIGEVTDPVTPDTSFEVAAAIARLDFSPVVGYGLGNLDELRWMFVGLLLIVIMIWRPDGLLGDRKEVASPINLAERTGGSRSTNGAPEGDETVTDRTESTDPSQSDDETDAFGESESAGDDSNDYDDKPADDDTETTGGDT